MENILTSAPYTQYHTMVYNSQIGNYYEIGDSCDIDNVWNFKADYSYELSLSLRTYPVQPLLPGVVISSKKQVLLCFLQ